MQHATNRPCNPLRRLSAALLLALTGACAGGGSGGASSSASAASAPAKSAWNYVLNFEGTVMRYVTDGEGTRILAEDMMPAFQFSFVADIQLVREGRTLYALDSVLDRIERFDVDPRTGAYSKTPGQDLSFSIASSASFELDPLERFLYVIDGGTLVSFEIDADSGELTEIGSTAIPSGDFVADQIGERLAFLDGTLLWLFDVLADGTLDPVDFAPASPDADPFDLDPFNAFPGIRAIAFGPEGDVLYEVTPTNFFVREFVGNEPKTTKGNPTFVSGTPRDLVVLPSGELIHALFSGGQVASFH